MVYPHNQLSTETLCEKTIPGINDSEKTEKDELEWTPDLEVSLFYSMVGHKPVGPNRFFQMYFVHQNFCNLICKDVDVSVIWKKLETMYDLGTLDESESVTTKGEKFSLPQSIFGEFMDKAKLNIIETEDGVKNNKDSNTETPIAKLDETSNKKDDILLPKDVKLDNNSKTMSVKKESKDLKKVIPKEKDKKEQKKEVQDAVKEAKEVLNIKEDDKEFRKNEKLRKDQQKENRKSLKKEFDKKTTDQPKKDVEGKKTESLKKSDTKAESTKSNRIDVSKKELNFDKRKETPDKKSEIKGVDKKLEIKSDKRSDLNKSIDKKTDIKSLDKKSDKTEKKSDTNKNNDKKNDPNKTFEKKIEKKGEKKLEKVTSSGRSTESGNNSDSTKAVAKLKERKEKESDGEKHEKEHSSLKRLRDSWSPDDTPVKRVKGRPTRNSGDAGMRPQSSNVALGKRRRIL